MCPIFLFIFNACDSLFYSCSVGGHCINNCQCIGNFNGLLLVALGILKPLPAPITCCCFQFVLYIHGQPLIFVFCLCSLHVHSLYSVSLPSLLFLCCLSACLSSGPLVYLYPILRFSHLFFHPYNLFSIRSLACFSFSVPSVKA